MTMPLIELRGLSKTFDLNTTALSGLTISIEDGESVAIVGTSGSGKSTLLSLLGLLELPSAGTYHLNGIDASNLREVARTYLRRKYIGFVFQSFQLIPHLTALENVTLSARIAGVRSDRAAALLESLGLGDRIDWMPAQMSGGEQQRVAIARALVRTPKLLLCDEPTGNLDSASTSQVLDYMVANRGAGSAMIVVTHDMTVARRCDRVVQLHDGRILEDSGRSVNRGPS